MLYYFIDIHGGYVLLLLTTATIGHMHRYEKEMHTANWSLILSNLQMEEVKTQKKVKYCLVGGSSHCFSLSCTVHTDTIYLPTPFSTVVVK